VAALLLLLVMTPSVMCMVMVTGQQHSCCVQTQAFQSGDGQRNCCALSKPPIPETATVPEVRQIIPVAMVATSAAASQVSRNCERTFASSPPDSSLSHCISVLRI